MMRVHTSMLTWLFNHLAQDYSFLNVFRYLTFRGICGVLTAIGIFFVFGPAMIRKLSYYQIGQTVRDDGPPTHFSKVGTPTMGGALILFAVVVANIIMGRSVKQIHLGNFVYYYCIWCDWLG